MSQWCTSMQGRSFIACQYVLLVTLMQSGATVDIKAQSQRVGWLFYPCASFNMFVSCLTWSNSSRSTSPSPFRSNILKAISKFLWGAEHHGTQEQIQKSIQHNMKTTCHTGSTQVTAKEFNTDSVITHQLCNIFSFHLTPQWRNTGHFGCSFLSQ